MKRLFVAVALACWGLGLVGCAKITDRVWRFVSAKVDAVAVVNGQLMQGEMALAPDRSGTLTLAAPNGSVLSCVGPVRYTSTKGGVVDLRCDEGSSADLGVTMLADTKGFAYGQTATGSVSVSFGFSLQDARAYLRLPADKKLVEVGSDGLLELQ